MHLTKNVIALGFYATCIAFFVYGAIHLNYLSIGLGVVFLMAATKTQVD